MALPKLTPEQRARALEKAAAVRRDRAALKQALKEGTLTFAELLARAETDRVAGGIKVAAALTSLPGLGKVKAHRLMEKLGIAESRRLRGLGAKQREALIGALS
ncbi:MAG TPA: integration host factor, actinobacterial type [Acidimicrobiia bacterium]|nr:integration host factor, actinobacterial type [Acidimicrobiia bacterium]